VALVLCWPQTFKELSLSPFKPTPRSFRKRVQKYYLFPNWQALFSSFFEIFYIWLNINIKLFSNILIFENKSVFLGKKIRLIGDYFGYFDGTNSYFAIKKKRKMSK
jgi:hypothetical protein